MPYLCALHITISATTGNILI